MKKKNNMPEPLEGSKVLSFDRALSGPCTSVLLCDLELRSSKSKGPDAEDIDVFFYVFAL